MGAIGVVNAGGRVRERTPNSTVDAIVKGTREHIESVSAFLLDQPPGTVSDETWSTFEATLLRVDEAFDWLRGQGYSIAS